MSTYRPTTMQRIRARARARRQVCFKLTTAQRSALECYDGGGLDPLVNRGWDRENSLCCYPDEVTDLYMEIVELSNSEDYDACERLTGRRDRAQARGAALALANLAGKIIRTPPTGAA